MTRVIWLFLIVLGCGSTPVEVPAPAPAPAVDLTTPSPEADVPEYGGGPCRSPSQCFLFQPDCFACMDRTSYAVTRDQRDTYNKICAVSSRVDPGLLCETLGFPNDEVAVCTAGRCTLLKLSETPMTACTTDEDCLLRPASCCGCRTEPVAISRQGLGEFQKRICEGVGNCAACAIPRYTGVSATCVAGRCTKTGKWDRTSR